MRLRPYQREGVDRARDDLARYGRALIVLATGLGKTVMFCATGREMRAEGARKVLLLAHRDELLDQARAKWLAIEPDAVVGIYQGARRESWADVICASVQSCYPDVIGEDGAIKRRGRIHDLPLGDIDLVIVDECHRIVSPTYEAVLESVLAANPNVGVLAVTATPARADGKGLGKWFDRVSYRMGIKEGIDGGYLAPLRGVRVELQIDLSEVKIARNGDYDDTDLGRVLDTDSAREHIVRKWTEMVGPGSEDGAPGGRFTAAFSPTVAAAEHLAAEFERAGVSAGVVSGTTKKKDRKRILDAYQHREIRVLCNVGVLTEGWDAPHTDCILMARPTKSGVLYRQAVGRGTRLSDGKADCIVLDCVGANALGLQTVLDLSTPGADRVPGVDPEPEDELTLDDGEQISMDVGDEIEARRVVGVTAYEIDMLGGGVHWVRCMSARVATVDVGKSMVVYPDRGAWSAMLFRGREVDVIAERRPERETMRAAEAVCAEIGVPRMLVPTTYRARMPATEKQIQMLGVLVERNTVKAPLDLSSMPAPNRMGAHQIGAWISYLHARMVMASRSVPKGRDMNETQSTVTAREVET
jgi:superfamily II DNA or RNA helicase